MILRLKLNFFRNFHVKIKYIIIIIIEKHLNLKN